MISSTPTACEVWVGDRWVNESQGAESLRITMVDPHLGLVEAQTDLGVTTTATIAAFVSTHRSLGRSELAAEHGWF